jgi:signal transduction histidine kinase
MPQGLPRKIRVAFILQVLAVSLAVVACGWVVSTVVKHGFVQRASQVEAEDFFMRRAGNPAHPAPNSRYFEGWFVPAGATPDGVPAGVARLSPGFHQLEQQQLAVRVDRRPEGTLYLLYDRASVDRLLYGFAVLPIVLALVAVLLVSWLTYSVSKRLVTPVNWLAREVASWDPRRPDIGALSPERLPADIGSGEARQLASALHALGQRVEAFVARERNFTRDASHELRTPLTVIRVAADLLEAETALSPRGLRSLQRIQRASRDMETVIDAFLILAREADIPAEGEAFAVADVVAEEVDKVQPLLEGKPVQLRVVEDAKPQLRAPSRVLGVMLGNLLSNAVQYTDHGDIEVRIEADRLSVRDTGIGMSPETLRRAFEPFYRAEIDGTGMGLGLSVVRRLGERFGWPVTLESAPGSGTLATILFPVASGQR